MSEQTRTMLTKEADGRSDQSAAEVLIQVAILNLRTLNEGLLLPWIAPAIRGLILRPLRDHTCRTMGGYEPLRTSGLANWREQTNAPDNQRQDQQRDYYCAGCRKNATCDYGRVFEPDLNVIAPSFIQRGDRQGVRGISVASAMLFSENASSTTFSPTDRGLPIGRAKRISEHQLLAPVGTELSLRLLALGSRAITLLPTVIQAIDGLGRISGIGYQAPVRYLIEPERTLVEHLTLVPGSLSHEICGGMIPEVTFDFLSPLLIKNCVERGRLIVPTFHDLFSNSVRTVIRAVREFAQPEFLLDANLRDFFANSREIQACSQRLIPFTQTSISHRGGVHRRDLPQEISLGARAEQTNASRVRRSQFATSELDDGQVELPTRGANRSYSERPLRGWLGRVTYKRIPASYLPWLHYAGLIGVGTDRNRGAGLWRITL